MTALIREMTWADLVVVPAVAAPKPESVDRMRSDALLADVDLSEHLECIFDPARAPAPVAGARWIPLTRGKWALVDDADFERVSARGWCAHRQVRNGIEYWYAVASTKKEKPYLHRFIVGAERGQLVDHRNGNTLDNRRQNLRVATRAQNAMNRRPTTDRAGYKGVIWSERDGKWIAGLSVDGRRVHLGLFDDAVEAARAYDRGAREHFGEFARCNFPEDA